MKIAPMIQHYVSITSYLVILSIPLFLLCLFCLPLVTVSFPQLLFPFSCFYLVNPSHLSVCCVLLRFNSVLIVFLYRFMDIGYRLCSYSIFSFDCLDIFYCLFFLITVRVWKYFPSWKTEGISGLPTISLRKLFRKYSRQAQSDVCHKRPVVVYSASRLAKYLPAQMNLFYCLYFIIS